MGKLGRLIALVAVTTLVSVTFDAAASAAALKIDSRTTFADNASADGDFEIQTHKNVFTNLETKACMDDSAYGLRAFPCNGSDFQFFLMTIGIQDAWIIKNWATGRCVDDSAYGLRSFSCNNTKFQHWWQIRNGDGRAYMNLATGRCLDDSNYGLRAVSCNGLRFQQWQTTSHVD
jgi:hypothetical protein